MDFCLRLKHQGELLMSSAGINDAFQKSSLIISALELSILKCLEMSVFLRIENYLFKKFVE